MSNNLLVSDCRTRLRDYSDNYFDSCIVDPPYELNFMGKAWDRSGIAFDAAMWAQVLRVLKPGAHLLAFGGSRTYHRIACAIEDAGFEIRDQIMWVYGSGFPKSLDVSKAIDKAAGAERQIVGVKYEGLGNKRGAGFNQNGTAEGITITAAATPEAADWSGWGTALKPAHEPICLARKPLEKGLTVAQNVLKWGTGGLNVDGCRIPSEAIRTTQGGNKINGGNFANATAETARRGNTVFENTAGRWPANLIHDGSEEVVAGFPFSKSGGSGTTKDLVGQQVYGTLKKRIGGQQPADEGSAARFFYCAKASTAERGPGNDHPCVKPQALLRYLARLVTPRGGRILDHFCGSGSGPLAFTAEGFGWDAIDLDPHNIAIAQQRLQVQQAAAGLYAHPFTTSSYV